MVPKTKNGAKGISLFIPCFFEKAIKNNPIIAPDQNATTTPLKARESPSNHPSPNASFASPRPIQVPFDISHTRAKGNEINIPDENSRIDGKCMLKP